MKRNNFVTVGKSNHCLKMIFAFTLAEMMVVMLIMSIILAAMAPVMTTKTKADKTTSSSPWKWVENKGPDAYFGEKAVQRAMIGMEKAELGDNGRLIIDTSEEAPNHIVFKDKGHNVGKLLMTYDGGVVGTNLSNIIIGSGTISNGFANVAIGNIALNNSSGSDNIAIGHNANGNYSATPINANGTTAIGASAKATAHGAIAIGSSASISSSPAIVAAQATAQRAMAIGSNTRATGTGSIAIGSGDYAGSGPGATYYTIASGAKSIAIGNRAEASHDDAIAIGNLAKAGQDSVAIGKQALSSVSSGVSNIALGPNALKSNTTGNSNIAIGLNALSTNTITDGNVAIGKNALSHYANSSSYKNDEYANVAIGANALQSSIAPYNIAIGSNALSSTTTGYGNVAIGNYALKNNVTGVQNIALGFRACSNVTGSHKICIGADSGPANGSDAATNSNPIIYLGDKDTDVIIPGNLVVGGHTMLGATGGMLAMHTNDLNKIQTFQTIEVGGRADYGYGVYTEFASYGMQDFIAKYSKAATGHHPWEHYRVPLDPGSLISDMRLKYVGSEFKSGLDKIKQLKVFNYTFKQDGTKTPHVGVIAQDLQKVFPDAVTKGRDGYLTIRMEDMFYALVNAVKELDAKITELISKVQNDNKVLTQKVNKLEKENSELKARLDKIEAKLK